jgi:hypothetical protein
MDVICHIYTYQHSLRVWQSPPVVPSFKDLEAVPNALPPPLKLRRAKDREVPGPKPGAPKEVVGIAAADLAALLREEDGAGDEGVGGEGEGEEGGLTLTGPGYDQLLSQASAVPDVYEAAVRDPSLFAAPVKSLDELLADEMWAREEARRAAARAAEPARPVGGSFRKRRLPGEGFPLNK